ncbi:uncharacterized protein [Lepeophtheirus salmonis]|nr:uncharacterized protein LOC121129756 isoform X1 [Lepeophtheirus salmonis]
MNIKIFIGFGILILLFNNVNFFKRNGMLMQRKVYVPIEKCNCSRAYYDSYFKWLSDDTLYAETTCSETAWRRGSKQKVMSYTYYANSLTNDEATHAYIKGIAANVQSIKKFFPGWAMRLYYDVHSTHPLYKDMCRLVCQNNHVDLCNVRNLPGVPLKNASSLFGMLWRFFPTLDPQVDIIGSRDLDSVFTEREVAAVQEWMNSDKILHAMRDHPQHKTEILGGLWEANVVSQKARNLWKKSWDDLIVDTSAWTGKSGRGNDQRLLTRYIWNIWGHKNALHHDSYFCQVYSNSTPWPVQRKKGVNNFVGAVVKSNLTIWQECPQKCRKHSEWKLC